MFDRPDQQRDLRYAAYVAGLIFFYALAVWIGNQRLLAFWIGFIIAVPTYLATYIVLRLVRLISRLTGLDKPANRAKERVRSRIDDVVEELEEEIEEPR